MNEHWLTQLRKRFPEPAFHVIEQVRNGTGWSRSPRTADAIVIGTWPSRGLELIGVEVKSDRRDWMRELKDPAKAEEIARYCDKWYLLATNDKVAKLDEIPPMWGYLLAGTDKLKTMKDAPVFPKPTPVDRLFLAAIVRAVKGTSVPRSEIETRVSEMLEERVRRDVRTGESELRGLREKVQHLTGVIAEFEREAGVSFGRSSWDGLDEARLIGKAVRLPRAAGINGEVNRLRTVARGLADIQQRIERVMAEYVEGEDEAKEAKRA